MLEILLSLRYDQTGVEECEQNKPIIFLFYHPPEIPYME